MGHHVAEPPALLLRAFSMGGGTFTGKIVFQEETIVSRLLHNQTAFMAQWRLVFAGRPMFVLPVRAL